VGGVGDGRQGVTQAFRHSRRQEPARGVAGGEVVADSVAAASVSVRRRWSRSGPNPESPAIVSVRRRSRGPLPGIGPAAMLRTIRRYLIWVLGTRTWIMAVRHVRGLGERQLLACPGISPAGALRRCDFAGKTAPHVPEKSSLNRTLHLHARVEWGRKERRRRNHKMLFCPRFPHLAR
jgi:hypothetical protein